MDEVFMHASFDREMAFYESIRTGNLETAKLLSTPLCSEGYGILSKNPLRNLKYHLVVSVSMITRFCISGGLSPEEAYCLSDSYIIRADEADTEEEVRKIHSEMILGFTKKMHNIKIRNIYSRQIVKAVDYINTHINEKISVQNIADYLDLSVPYLSRLFKSETGLNISEYISVKKVESASAMLKYSSQTTSEISYILNFSSQSYFTKVFRKYTGMTPGEYRRRFRFMPEISDSRSETIE
ncbi:MAG: helix-turn-helix domain-containing protein [Porcipelethomonas sp.]